MLKASLRYLLKKNVVARKIWVLELGYFYYGTRR
jgi:hypothetical protein